MSVEKRQLLRAVCGVVGRVQIDGDARSAMAQPLGMASDHAHRQELARTIEFLYPNSVLETRQCRLRSQVETIDWIAVQKQFVNRVPGQASRVVGVRVTAGNREHALSHQLAQRMIDLARLPLVSEARGQPIHQSITAISRLQQQGSAVGTPLALIKLGHHRLAKNSWEQQTL